MHSSRTCTGCSLTVCRSLLPGGVYWVPGGVCSRGVSDPRGCVFSGGGGGGGVCSRGVWYPSMHWGRHPRLWTESHTPVKTLPWPNFVAAGKNGNKYWKNERILSVRKVGTMLMSQQSSRSMTYEHMKERMNDWRKEERSAAMINRMSGWVGLKTHYITFTWWYLVYSKAKSLNTSSLRGQWGNYRTASL